MPFVTVKTFDNYIDANIIRGRLEDEGIPCFLRDEYTVTINPFLSNAIGGIKLTVMEQDASAAETLLLRFEAERNSS